MIKNYLKTASRIIKRNKIYSLITVFSLAVGFFSGLLILLYVGDELSFDRYHENASRIFRVYEELNIQGQKRKTAITPAPFAPAMKQEIPQVEEAVRFLPGDFGGNEVLIRQGEHSFYENKWFFSDESVFGVFSFTLTKGNPKTALKAPYSVTLSETKAKKIFGNRDPIGQTITLEHQYFKDDFLVTGIFKDIPQNSHFTFDFLASFASVERKLRINLDNWFNHMFYTYLLLQKGQDLKEVEEKFPALIKKHTGDQGASVLQPKLQALTSIRLHSHLENEIEPNSDITYVLMFLTIAVFILGIAGINFINLTTARSVTRAKEVGMRKVVGAHRRQLIQQFLGESIFFALTALILALGFAYLFLPLFNTLADKSLSLAFVKTWWLPLALVTATVLFGGLAGVYPAFYLSRFVPASVLKGKQGKDSRSGKFRKGLIIFQFTISSALIILTFGVKDQLNYIQTKKLGFHKHNVVVMPLRDSSIKKQYNTLKNEMLRNNEVESVSASSGVPGRITHHWVVQPEGWASGEERPTVWVMMVDHDFVPTMGMEIDKGRVIGTVKDFHFQSFHQAIEPLILYMYPRHFSYLLIRLRGKDVQTGLQSVSRTWKKIVPNRPFKYFFLDQDFDRFYRAEQRAGKIFGGFALLAVIIALLGLFGLTTFTAEQKSKEVGIRKVLGASVPGLVHMLNSEFTRLVLIANVIAWPLAYYITGKWLQNFAYRTDTSIWIFTLAVGVTLGLTLITVSIQAFRTARIDPARVLRHE